MAWREDLHPRDARGRFAVKGSAPVPQIKATLADLTAAPDDDLFDVFHRLSSRSKLDTKSLTAIGAELARREGLAKLPPAAEPTPEEAHADDLIRRGYSYAEAYTEAYGKPAGRGDGVQIERREGESLEHARRRAYAELVDLQALQAEEATRANLVKGKCRGTDPAALWSASPARARRCATDELKMWWQDNGGRLTYQAWKDQLKGRATASTSGNGQDYGI
jgi:hypothetical protein